MTGHLLLDFPVLQPDSGDFISDIQYTVEAMNFNVTLKINHRLSGKSFISELLKSRRAKFSVQLFYQDCSERQTHTCCGEIDEETGGINATQDIPLGFSYLPVIKPSIVIVKDTKISTNENSGLTDFWEDNTEFEIPAYSRVAHHAKLSCTSGDISNLIRISVDERMEFGTMGINVSETANEGESPVTLTCAQDVYDELRMVKSSTPQDPRETMGSGMVTQALCAVYAYMHKRQSKDSGDGEEHRDISSILQAHHDELQTKTGMSWNDENFNPSLAATKMHPYSIKSLRSDLDNRMPSKLNLKTWNDFGSRLLQEKGHKRQKEFLTSCKHKDDFSRYMDAKLHGCYRSSSSSFLSDYVFTEAEFCSPPEDTQNMIWDRSNSCQLHKEILSDVCFWGEVVFNLIKRDQLKPEWLASSKGNSLEEGGYFIDRALNSNDSKMLDDCVRKILRSMCNPRPRGRRVVFYDFSLGRAWWRYYWADEMSKNIDLEFPRILEIMDATSYQILVEKMHSGRSYMSFPGILGGLLLFLDSEPIKGKALETVINGIDRLSIWKAIELRDPRMNKVEIHKIYNNLSPE